MVKQSETSTVHAAIMAFMGTVDSKVLQGSIKVVAAQLKLTDMVETLHDTLGELSRQGRIRYSRGAKGHIITLREPVTTRQKKRQR